MILIFKNMGDFYQAKFLISTVSEANIKEHWAIKAKRTRNQRKSACYLCKINFGKIKLPKDFKIIIYLSRRSPRLLDDDNLVSAFKAIRDGIADYLDLNDRDPRINWNYSQGKHKEQSCEISISINNN